MNNLPTLFALSFALIFVIEGLLYAIFPVQIQKMMTFASRMSLDKFRSLGGAMIALGALIIWVMKTF